MFPNPTTFFVLCATVVMANLHVPIYRPDLSDTINRLANQRVCMAIRCARDSNPTRRPDARKSRHFMRTRYFCSALFLVSMRNTIYYRRSCVTWLFMLPFLAAMAGKLQQTTEIIFSISSVLLLAATSTLLKKRKRKKEVSGDETGFYSVTPTGPTIRLLKN